MDERLHICLLGEFSIARGNLPIKSLHAERPQTLLAYLLLHRQAPVPRQHLAYTLWPDSVDEQARTNLRNLLHTLRRALPDADRYLFLDSHTVQWQPSASYTLDVAAFQEAIAANQQPQDVASRLHFLETAVSLYKGPLLPGNYDDWLVPIRETVYQFYLESLQQLANLLTEIGEYQAAIPIAQRWHKEDPLLETAVIFLMQLYAQIGDPIAIRRIYQACKTALREELDAEPSRETQAIYAAALQQAAAGDMDEKESITAVALFNRSSPRNTPQLPPHPTPFIGREAELATLAQWLADPHCRLITIAGPGGIGKSRLALQAANGHVTVFRHGAAFVPLAAITDPAILPSAIAQGLNIPLNTMASRREQLLQHLADKALLLVLDNLEQLANQVEFLSELLAAAPQLKLLVTSRHRLNLYEEWVFDLQSFPVPDTHNLQNMAENSAALLFLQSARRHNSAFNPDETEMRAIARICQLVDGMPLGLELAAPWTRLLSCVKIAQEIEKNLDFLTSNQQNIPDRHRSMRAIFSQSWQMLTVAEQTVFCKLSLFRGGFDQESAEQIAEANLTILANLLDKSLLRRLGNGRYDIHELLRQYAADKLGQTTDQTALQNRFADYFLTIVETAVSHLTGPHQQEWLDRLELEYDNLRLALGWAIDLAEAATAVRLGAALGRYWWLRYRPIEGGNWLRQILALPGPPTENRARAMSYAGLLARLRRDYPEAESWLRQSIAWQRQSDQKQDLGRSLNELGMVAIDQGEFAQAQTYFEEWLGLARELNFPHGISIALLNLGMAAHQQGAYKQATDYFQEALTIARKQELKTNEAMIRNSFSMLLLDQKEWQQAKANLLQSVQINYDLGHQDGLSWAFWGLLTLAYMEDNLEWAACLAGVLNALRQTLGAPLPPTNQAHFEKIISDLQQRLGEENFTYQQNRGLTIPLNDIISLVLADNQAPLTSDFLPKEFEG